MSQAPSGPDLPPEEVVPNGTVEAPAQNPETPEEEHAARYAPEELNQVISERATALSEAGKSQEEIVATLTDEFSGQLPPADPGEAAALEAVRTGEQEIDAAAMVEATSQPETPQMTGISDEEFEQRRRDQLSIPDRMVENFRDGWADLHGMLPEWMQAAGPIIERPLYNGFMPRDPINSLSYGIAFARGIGKALMSVDNMLLGALGYSMDELPNPDEALGVSNGWAPGFVEAGTQYGVTSLAIASGAYVLLPTATASATGLVPALAGVGGDAAAFDPRQGGIVTFVSPLLGEESQAFLRNFDPKYLAETTGGQAAGRAALVLEGTLMTLTFGGFLKGTGAAVKGYDAIGRGFQESSIPKGMAFDVPGMSKEQAALLRMELPPEVADLPMDPEAAKHFARYISVVTERAARAEQLYAEGKSSRDIIRILDEQFGQTAKELHDEHWLEGQAIMLQRATAGTDNPLTLRQARTAVNAYAKAGMDHTSTFFVSPAMTREADQAVGNQVLRGDRTLLQEGADGAARGSVRIDPYDEAAFITLYREADVSTINEEMGHVLRGQLTGPRAKQLAATGKGTLSADEIKNIEDQYGVVDGRWTVDQEEAFAADMRAFILENADKPELSKEFAWMAAHLRTVLDDARSGGLSSELTDASRDLWAILKNKRNLPIRYGDNKYLPAIEWSSVVSRIKELDESGEDWTSLLSPDTLLSNAGLRTSISNTSDLKKYMAVMEDLARELREQNVLMRPKKDSELSDSAYELYASFMGQDVDEAVAFLSVTHHTKQDMDDQVMLGNLILLGQGEKLMDLMRKADQTKSVTDMALLQRQYIQFQMLTNAVARLRTQTGRALRAYRWPGVLPSEKQIAENEAQALAMLEAARGNRKGQDWQGLEGEELIKFLKGLHLTDDARLIAEGVRNSNDVWGSKWRGVMQEFYVNGLLSSPSTVMGISILSPSLIMMTEGLGKLMWALPGAIAGGARSREVVRDTAKRLALNVQNFGEAIRWAAKAWGREEGVLMGSKYNLDDAKFRDKAISVDYEGDNFFMRGIEWLVNKGGQAVRIPSRGIMFFDEFFRQMNARGGTLVELWRQEEDAIIAHAIDHGLLPVEHGGKKVDRFHHMGRGYLDAQDVQKAIQSRVGSKYETIIKDGRIRDRAVLLDEARNDVDIAQEENPVARGFAMAEYIDRESRKQPANVVQHAEREAVDAVLQTELGRGGQMVQAVLDWLPGGRFIVPFYRTPVNALKRAAVYFTPLSVPAEIAIRAGRAFSGKGFSLPDDSPVKIMYESHMMDLASKDPNRVAAARGRQVLGTAALTSVYLAAENGTITGYGPRDPDLRKQWMEEGWRPYSIKIGGIYYSYAKLDPLASVLGTAADFTELYIDTDRYGDDNERAALQAIVIMALGQQLQSKSMLQGFSDFNDVLANPSSSHAEAYINRLLVNVTPIVNIYSSMQRNVDQINDPRLKQVRSLVDQYRVQSLLGDSSLVAPRYNVIGEEVTKWTAATPVAMRVASMFLPIGMSAETDEIIPSELARLGIPNTAPNKEKYGVNLEEIPGIDGKDTAWDSWQMLIGLPADDPNAVTMPHAHPDKPGQMTQPLTLKEYLLVYFKGDLRSQYEMDLLTPADVESDEGTLTAAQVHIRDMIEAYRRLALDRLIGGPGDKPNTYREPLIPALAAAYNETERRGAEANMTRMKLQNARPEAVRRQQQQIDSLSGKTTTLLESERRRIEEFNQK